MMTAERTGQLETDLADLTSINRAVRFQQGGPEEPHPHLPMSALSEKVRDQIDESYVAVRANLHATLSPEKLTGHPDSAIWLAVLEIFGVDCPHTETTSIYAADLSGITGGDPVVEVGSCARCHAWVSPRSDTPD